MSAKESLPSTCTPEEASMRLWDVVVIGAGPSGSLAARQLAAEGAAVLLADKAGFPRPKVCGCYLNGSALATLEAVGLGGLPERLGAPIVSRVRLGFNHRTAEIALPNGAALSRYALDAELALQAVRAGSRFLARTEAKVGDLNDEAREVKLHCGTAVHKTRAKVVVVADGVGGQSLKECRDIEYKLASRSLVGTSATSDSLPANYSPGTIHMAIGRAGYVGALQLEDGRLDVAAAFDPGRLKDSSPGDLAQLTADQSGLPALSGLGDLRWLGTPPLSRTPTRPAAHRLFLVGDAAGYVEPFTGEGISWALSSARLVVPFVLRNIESNLPDLPQQWAAEHRRLLKPRQRVCRWLTRGLRRPWLASASVAALHRMPSLAAPVVRWLNKAPGLNNE